MKLKCRTFPRGASAASIAGGNGGPLERLDLDERRALHRCDAIVAKGATAFVEVGLALADVKERRLYREEFATFEDDCRDRLKCSRSLGYRLITHAAMVIKMGVSPIGDKLGAESQARELARVPREMREEVLRLAVGRDFLAATGHGDWSVNPPVFAVPAVSLVGDGAVADHIVFVALVRAWFVRARQEDMRKAGFALVDLCALPIPPNYPQFGLELAADGAHRGWQGARTTIPGAKSTWQ